MHGVMIKNKKWQAEFKSWKRLFAFHFLLMPLEKAQIYLFLQTELFSNGMATGLEGKF